MTISITELIQTLCMTIKEVLAVIDYRPQVIVSRDLVVLSEERTNDVSIPIP